MHLILTTGEYKTAHNVTCRATRIYRCHYCGERIAVGDEYFTVHERTGSTREYHKGCRRCLKIAKTPLKIVPPLAIKMEATVPNKSHCSNCGKKLTIRQRKSAKNWSMDWTEVFCGKECKFEFFTEKSSRRLFSRHG